MIHPDPSNGLHISPQSSPPLSKGGMVQVTDAAAVPQPGYSSDETVSLRELIQNTGFWRAQEIKPWIRPSPTMWRFALMLGDGSLLLALLALLLVCAPALQVGLNAADLESSRGNTQLIWICLALVSWGIAVKIAQSQELINASNRLRSLLSTVFAILLMLLFWMLLSYPFIADEGISYVKMSLIFGVVAVPVFSIWRVLVVELIHSPRFRHRAVIVGVNTAGETMARELRSSKRPIADLLGYISEDADAGRQVDGLPILGGRRLLRHLVRHKMLDLILMAIDYRTNPELFQEAFEATQQGIAVVPMATTYERATGKIPVEHIGDQWYLSLPSEPVISLFYLCWRKIMDIAFALCGLLVLLLVLPVMALLIRLDSPGPIFYSQERLGYQGKKFRVLKFRSMYRDAECAGCAVWAAKGDRRVTRVGRILRATHLDELPQVLNILRGEMSLVGPRPEREEFATPLEKTIPFYRCRLSVKPGLTGWAQVKYPYTSSDYKMLIKLQYDLYYIKYQSFVLDICIILQTVREMLLCHGR